MTDFDVLCIGNAIVDILARCDDEFLQTNGIIKGAMNLIDAEQAISLYDKMGPAIEASGGSASNTAAGIANFGGKAAYFGKVAKDELGKIFTHDLRAQGVAFDTEPLESGSSTARSMILITPDGERSMNTYLGACVELGPDDVEADKVKASKVTYFEGYLWDPPQAKLAIRMAADIAHQHDRLVAMTLSDSFCVDRYRDEFLELMQQGVVDIVFSNEDELKSLYQTPSFDEAAVAIGRDCKLAAITRSAQGSVVVDGDNRHDIPAISVEHVVDTTGAGDLYAAGFMFGYTQGMDYARCARLGALAAGIIIGQIGPRPHVNLADVAAKWQLL